MGVVTLVAPTRSPSLHPVMQIFLRVCGTTQVVECEHSDPVSVLHDGLPTAEGGSDHYLTHGGRCLADPGATLGECQVGAGSTVQVLYRLNGGGNDGLMLRRTDSTMLSQGAHGRVCVVVAPRI